MAIPNIQINKQNGGIVRGLPSDDSISGLIAYAAVPASFATFSSGSGYKVFYSAQEAYNSGVVGDFSDEIAATASITLTGTGGTNNGLNLSIGAPINFTFAPIRITATSSTAACATQLAAGINNQLTSTGNPGFVATATASTVIITAPKSTYQRPLGTRLNGTVLTVVSIGGSPTFTKTNFAGAVNSELSPIKYHIDEYFRVGGTKLWCLLRPTPTANFDEIIELQNAALGEIRQMAIYNHNPFVFADINTLQSRANDLEDDKKYVQLLYGADIKGVELEDLTSLATLACENVSVVIGQDGGNIGKNLYDLLGYSITNIGSVLGAIAAFKVSESIAWVGKLQSIPYSTRELDVAAFANGDLVQFKTKAELESIANKQYIFLRKFDGLSGSFISDSLTATSPVSDFFSIERNRTIDKSRRLCAIALLPFLSSPLQVDANGKLDPLTIGVFNGLIGAQMDTMLNANELSAYSVNIDPDQDVLSTDKLIINLQLVPVGVARFIEVNVSFALSV